MKTLLITGASKGIGFKTAQRFADSGFRVINISRTPAPDDRIENHSVDLSLSDTQEQLDELLDLILDPGEICLVHNAAKLVNDRVGDTDPDSLQDILTINVLAPNILNQLVVPKMTAGSSIIYVGSTLAEKAVPASHSYVVSKHAIVGMMRATCQDLVGRQIHTACICPGFTDTEMLRTHVGGDESVINAISATCAYNRLVNPDEIATAIEFAANNPVINGAVIHANLGQIER